MSEKLFSKKSFIGDIVKGYTSNMKIVANKEKFEELQKCSDILSILTQASQKLEELEMFECSNTVTDIISKVTKRINDIETPEEIAHEKVVDINEAWDQNTAVFAEKIKSVIRK